MMSQSTQTQSKAQPLASSPRSTGSVYLVTLITVAAIVSMVLVGIKLRSADNTKSTLVESMVENSNSMIDATEYALVSIANNSSWNTQAQTGIAFNEFQLNGIKYTGTVTDSTTKGLPTKTSTEFQISVASTSSSTRSNAQFEVLCSKIDYQTLVGTYHAESYWPLNESRGDTLALDPITKHDGTYLNPSIAGVATNEQGAQVPLFSSSGDNIEIPWNSSFKHKQGSFTAWIKSTEQKDFVSYGILGSAYSETTNPNLMLIIIGGGLYAFVGDDGSYSYKDVAGSAVGLINTNQWHHVALTWGTAGLTIYLDGVQVAQNTDNTSGLDTGKTKDGGELPINIGASYISILSKATKVNFVGSIAHVVYFDNQQLTDAEVAEIAKVIPDHQELQLIEDSWTMVYE